MTSKTKKLLIVFIAVIYFTAIGFFREHIFVSVNYQIAKLYYNDSFEWQLPSDLKFLENYTYAQLYYGKWIITLVFCVLYFIPSFLIIRKIFKEKIFLRITAYSHLIVFLLGGFFYLIGYLTSDMDRWYSFSRNFLGFLQSPMMLIILIPSFFILGKENNS